ncbi:Mpv17/PMP22 [Dillenia turbinata]|uniref:Mpv17/PMP22 n=1 Tax=Dillenia turbinata TaxID=194707 RepID=A0AAN8UXN6_9MAGN
MGASAATNCNRLCALTNPRKQPKPNNSLFPTKPSFSFSHQFHSKSLKFKNPTRNRRNLVIGSVAEDQKVDISTQTRDAVETKSSEGSEEFEGLSETSSEEKLGSNKYGRLTSRAINASIVLGVGTVVITKLLTIDHDYWHGWTLYEVLRYAPEHNWIAYEQALKTNPVFAKMLISGFVYSVGDWIAQCYEGKPLLEFDRTRMFRSGLVGFLLHGSLSHYYYQFCEALFPFQGWWVVPAKVVFDQTAWSAVWNSIYYVVLGFLRRESPANILSELKTTFWPLLTAGWKLWPFAHLITYGVIPVEQRLLWVDCVELIWVTILSTYSNEKSEARISEASLEAKSTTSTKGPDVGEMAVKKTVVHAAIARNNLVSVPSRPNG